MLRYAITDRGLFGGNTAEMLRRLVEVAPLPHSMLDYIQLRERDLAAGELERIASQMMQGLRGLPARPRLLINHRADVALAAGADGVHLRSGPGEMAPQQVQQLFAAAGAARPVVSVSCHSLEDVARAQQADLVLFGPVFEKPVPAAAALPGIGLDKLAEACALSQIPLLALGGVTQHNAEACLHAGAAGIAGIRCFLGSQR